MNYLDIKQIDIDLAHQIKQWAKDFGFNSVGITDIDLSDDQRYLDRWLENGYQGEMNYLKRNNSKREFPDQLVEGTKRIISVTMNYLPEDYNGKELLENTDKAFISNSPVSSLYFSLFTKLSYCNLYILLYFSSNKS